MPDLDALFWPRSIALIGASPDKSGIRGRIVDAVRQHGFQGPIYPVSRSHTNIDGLTAYPDVGSIPEPVDLAIVTIPAVYVVAALQACGERGVRAAVIISSGFAEERGEDGIAREDGIRDVVARYDMAVLGPNGEGYMNAAMPIDGHLQPHSFRPGRMDSRRRTALGVALAWCRKAVASAFSFFNRGRPKELRFSFVISMGNEAGLEGLDAIDYLLEDKNTHVVLGFRGKLSHASQVRRRWHCGPPPCANPLVLAKVGASEAGAHAAASHTASLAGSQRSLRGDVPSVTVLSSATTWTKCSTLPPAFLFFATDFRKVSGSPFLRRPGGAGYLAWPTCAKRTDCKCLLWTMKPVRPSMRLLPAYGSSRNPVDVTAQVIFHLGYAPVLELIAASPSVDAVLVAGSLGLLKYVKPQLDALSRLGKSIDMPVIFCAYTLAHPEAVDLLARAGFPCLTSMPNAARTLSAMADYQRFLERRAMEADESGQAFEVPAEVVARLAGSGGILYEYQAKALLAELGLADNPDTLASSEEQAVAAAARLGQAVALKVQSPDISHRSQVGAVALDLQSEAAVRNAYRTVLENARRQHPDADIDGVSVSPMSERGVEIIIGISRDPDFGAIVVLGAGGTLVEVLDDVIVTPAPASRVQVLELLDGWKGKRLLDGSAGSPPADIDALVDLTVMVSRFAASAPSLSSLDLNPVLVHPRGQGVSVVDALIITDAHASGNHATAAE